MTSSPVLAQYDSTNPTFLKTDWIAFGMTWILLQPADDEDCVSVMDKLKKESICLFDLSLAGPRLRPIAFGSRNCSTAESHLHSFVG